ncbi:MAG: helix-turn-helix domain-containing protein [Anaerolineae bacterium]
MSELGQWLREAREARGLSLADVEKATRIRQSYLSALEADDWDALPNETVGRGFLRNYAKFLGLDPEELIRQRQAEIAWAEEEPLIVAPVERPVDYRPIEFDLRLEDAESRREWRWPVVVVVLALVVALGAWVAIQRPDLIAALGPAPTPTATATSLPSPQPTATFTPTPEAPTPTPTVGIFLLPTPTPTATPTPEPTPIIVEAQVTPEVRLITRVVDRSWLRVVVDGQVVLENILEPGDEREWIGQQSVTVRSGNAGGVAIVLGGVDLGVMGEPGQVVERTWVWSDADGGVIEQEPTITTEEANVSGAGGGFEPLRPPPTPVPTPTPAG